VDSKTGLGANESKFGTDEGNLSIFSVFAAYALGVIDFLSISIVEVGSYPAKLSIFFKLIDHH
jgi:hypothetical protein